VISHNGKRTSGDINPCQASAVFTGTGFGSMNKSLKSQYSLRCKRSARLESPLMNDCTSSQISAGKRLDATLTTPTAPTDINGSVSPSSLLKIVMVSGKRGLN